MERGVRCLVGRGRRIGVCRKRRQHNGGIGKRRGRHERIRVEEGSAEITGSEEVLRCRVGVEEGVLLKCTEKVDKAGQTHEGPGKGRAKLNPAGWRVWELLEREVVRCSWAGPLAPPESRQWAYCYGNLLCARVDLFWASSSPVAPTRPHSY